MSFKFTGNGDFLSSSSGVTVQNLASGAVTLAGWFRATTETVGQEYGIYVEDVGQTKIYKGTLRAPSIYQAVVDNNDGTLDRVGVVDYGASPWVDEWDHYAFVFPSIHGSYLVWKNARGQTVNMSGSGAVAGFAPAVLALGGGGSNLLMAEVGLWNSQLAQADIDQLAGSNVGGSNGENIGSPFTPSLVQTPSCQHSFTLLKGDTGGVDGRNDKIGTAGTLNISGSASTQVDHPPGMVYRLTSDFRGILIWP